MDFFVDFEFRSRILQAAIGVVFNEAVRRMVGAFNKRAREVYGPPIVPQGATRQPARADRISNPLGIGRAVAGHRHQQKGPAMRILLPLLAAAMFALTANAQTAASKPDAPTRDDAATLRAGQRHA